MNINTILDAFIENNRAIFESISETIGNFRNKEDIDRLLPKLTEIVKKSKYNPAFGVYFAGFLQLTSKNDIRNSFTPEDIEELYHTLLLIQDYNLEVYIQAAYYKWSTMDDPEEAKKIANEGIAKAEEKIKELKELLNKIDSE